MANKRVHYLEITIIAASWSGNAGYKNITGEDFL